MKILLSSLPFAPKVGGMETIAMLLAQEWSALGHSVTVVTETAEEAAENFPSEKRFAMTTAKIWPAF